MRTSRITLRPTFADSWIRTSVFSAVLPWPEYYDKTSTRNFPRFLPAGSGSLLRRPVRVFLTNKYFEFHRICLPFTEFQSALDRRTTANGVLMLQSHYANVIADFYFYSIFVVTHTFLWDLITFTFPFFIYAAKFPIGVQLFSQR